MPRTAKSYVRTVGRQGGKGTSTGRMAKASKGRNTRRRRVSGKGR